MMNMEDLEIAKPLTLPCGLTLRNRLTKAALAESWSDTEHLPSHQLIDAYAEWSQGGWGAALTGNLMIDVNYLSTLEDNALDESLPLSRTLTRWKEWATAASANNTPSIVQLNHPGRQGISWCGKQGFFSKNLAPSAIPLDLGSDWLSNILRALMFGTPREMTKKDIEHAVSRFALTAKLCAEAGFAGVEIHAAHGYLLSQFLSARSNKRTDEYGGDARQRAKIIVDVIHAIRESVPKGFCIGIKLNSADHQNEGELEEVLEQLDAITQAGVDFVEISGGTYEKPDMLLTNQGQVRKSTAIREAFFLDFAHLVRQRIPNVPLMVTGGFRSRRGMEDALKSGACDLIGLGRPAVLNPLLPKEVLLNPDVSNVDATLYTRPIPTPWAARVLKVAAVTGGAETSWYQEQMRKVFLKDDKSGRHTFMGKMFSYFFVY